MTFLLICLGALPFVLGGVMNWAMLTWQNSLPPLLLIALLLLLVWGLIAFLARPRTKSTVAVILPLNLIAFLVLLLLVLLVLGLVVALIVLGLIVLGAVLIAILLVVAHKTHLFSRP